MSKRDERVLELLQQKHISLAQLKRLLEGKQKSVRIVKKKRTKRYRFGIVSDTHLVDKSCAISELHDFYKLLKREKITEVVHAGDIGCGLSVYRGQVNDMLKFGLDDHLDYIVENYPKQNGITTYFINGN